MTLNTNELLALGVARRVTVALEGGEVLVRELSVSDRAQVVSLANGQAAKVPALVVRLCTLNPDGSPMFTEADDDKIAALRTDIVDPIARAVMKLSGMNAEGALEKKS